MADNDPKAVAATNAADRDFDACIAILEAELAATSAPRTPPAPEDRRLLQNQ